MKSPLKYQQNLAANAPVGAAPTQVDLPGTDFQQTPERTPSVRFAASEHRSPEAESFRALLKSRMPREKASPALLHKIRQITKNPA